MSDLDAFLEYNREGLAGYMKIKRAIFAFYKQPKINYPSNFLDAMLALRASPFFNNDLYGKEYRTLLDDVVNERQPSMVTLNAFIKVLFKD